MDDFNYQSEGWKLARRIMSQPGPTWGRGPGRPWHGIVDRTPAIWITWVKELCKMAGGDIERLGLRIYDEPIQVEGVALTFGTRHYFLCPHCSRRCEALFFVGRALCRKCARLGYHSQCHRPNSGLGEICRLYTRRGFWRRVHGGLIPCQRDKDMLMKLFREALEKHLLDQVEAVASAVEFGAEMERLTGRVGR